jgi:hypothetical protein
MDASALLQKMAATYAGLASYADQGVVTTTLIEGEQRQVMRRPFATAFQRPHRFRFEFTDESTGDRYTIWQEAPPARRQWTQQGDQVDTLELPLAIAGATGISGGSALTIPRLLMPALIHSRALTDLETPTLDGEEVIDGARCWRLQGRQGNAQQTLFIGAEDWLVRRLLAAEHFGAAELEDLWAKIPADLRAESPELPGPFDSETEIAYQPQGNAPLTDADFRGPV